MKKILAVSTALVLLLLGGICPAQAEEENGTPRILVAYFSLWGNADYVEDVDATTSASIVLTENAPLDENAKQRAQLEGVSVLTTSKNTYQVAAEISKLL